MEAAKKHTPVINIKSKNVTYPGSRGNGFVKDDGKIALTYCPQCGSENYALAVIDGTCAWCGWDANG